MALFWSYSGFCPFSAMATLNDVSDRIIMIICLLLSIQGYIPTFSRPLSLFCPGDAQWCLWQNNYDHLSSFKHTRLYSDLLQAFVPLLPWRRSVTSLTEYGKLPEFLIFSVSPCGTIQFNSETLIIPQGAILLWSWRARKKIHKVKRTIQQTKESYFNHSIVINIEQLWLHHKIVMKLRSHTCKTIN